MFLHHRLKWVAAVVAARLVVRHSRARLIHRLGRRIKRHDNLAHQSVNLAVWVAAVDSMSRETPLPRQVAWAWVVAVDSIRLRSQALIAHQAPLRH